MKTLNIKPVLPAIFALQVLIGAKAQALPTHYPENLQQIRNNTTSSVLSDNKINNYFYVLPPNGTSAKIKNLHTVTANVGFCKEISKIQEFNLDTITLINDITKKDKETEQLLNEQNTKLQKAQEELSQYVVANNMQELSALDLKIMQLEKRLDDLYIKYKNCTTECAVVNTDITESQLLRMELLNQRFELSATNYIAATEFEKRKYNVISLEKIISDISVKKQRIKSELTDLYVDFNRLYDAHTLREGGRVSIDYDSKWSENVQRLSQDNPGYRFVKSQTKNAHLKAGAYSKNGLNTGGAILSFEIGGMMANESTSLESFPEAFSGNAVLNLLGTCPVLHPEWFGITGSNGIDKMSYGLTVTYDYPAALKYEVTAKYNLYNMYKKIKKQGQSGGFFSSSSWNDESEEQFFKELFTVDWSIQDEKFAVKPEEKMAINNDIRRQILSRLAGNLYITNTNSKLDGLLPAPTSGAIVLANSLNKYCPASIYCQGASIVLNVMQAIFGSSEMSSSEQKTINVDITEVYSNTQIVMQPMITSFK